jgi:2-aminoadipate transaminase
MREGKVTALERPGASPPVAGDPAPRPDWLDRFARRATIGSDGLSAILSLAARSDVITFSGGFPAPETFPVEVVRSLADDLLTTQPHLALQYSPTEGLPLARAAIARLVSDRQGHVVDPHDVLVTSGSIEALALLGKTFLEPGDHVVVEAPTYLGAIMAFEGFEAQVDGVSVDEEGIRVDELEQTLARGPRPKLLYCIPDHQNPSGISLSAERRVALVETCRRYGVLVVEDIAYRELGWGGAALPSLWSTGPDVVVQIGTFSKIFCPGVRLGWAVGPAEVLAGMTAAKQNTDQCAGALGQMLAARFVDDGHLEPSLVTARALYRARATAMLQALEEHLPDGMTWTRPTGGFFVWLVAPDHVDARELAGRAAEVGVAYVPGSPFYTDGRGANCFRLAFSRATEADIHEGVRRLGTILSREVATT